MALPLVLAGPIVRRVEPRNVSVWIALSESANVTLTLFSGSQMAGDDPGTTSPPSDVLGTGTIPTRRVGGHLHVAVVSVELTAPDPALTPQLIHSYDVTVDGPGGPKGLKQLGLLRDETTSTRIDGVHADAPMHVALGYVTDRLPSFVAPAASVSNLRLAHASCRKPHGPADDALTFLDEELEDAYLDTDRRTQQLVLTGDQIYADDVASPLLAMLNGLAGELLGHEERLEATDGTPVPATLTNFPATRRQRLVDELAGFTTNDGSDHLLSFGEFAAMYCAVWSSRVWRTLPATASLLGPATGAHASVRDHLTDHAAYAAAHDDVAFPADWEERIDKADTGQRARVEAFRASVPRVARVLANCATYMIFDDHEVTDDWLINASWRNRVNARPLGRNVLRNGVMAYALFQAWGNDPLRWFGTPDDNTCEQLLTQIANGFDGAGPYPRSGLDTAKVNALVGTTNQPDKVAQFHYTVPGPLHTLVVLDTRTKRTLPGQGLAPPKLLGGSIDSQLAAGPFTDGRELLVVVSPVPVLGPELIDAVGAALARIVGDAILGVKQWWGEQHPDAPPAGSQWGSEKYEAESFTTDEEGMEKLLARLATYGQAVVLSGDVHYACTIAMDYWRKGVSDPDRIVQLTSSPASNRFKEVVEAVNRDSALPQAYFRGMIPERLGWSGKGKVDVPSGQSIPPGRRARLGRSPSVVPTRTWPAGTTLSAQPDWRWRATLVADERPSSERPPDLAPPSLPAPFTSSDPATSYGAVASRHQAAALDRHDHTRTVVFAPNVGLIEFSETSGRASVHHVLLSASGSGSGGARNTVHDVELDPQSVTVPDLVLES